MESDGILIKSEPMDDGDETSINREHDQVNSHQSVFIRNGFSVQETVHGTGTSRAFPTTGLDQESNAVGNTNFSCLLCDVVCQNRDDLRMHLKNFHKSKSNFFTQGPAQRADFYSSYVHFRYSCNICGAKFKTFKNYFSHSMSHKGYTNLQSSLNDAMLRSGKEVLQNYFDAEEGLPGTFMCNECKTVFVQRDSYAMHMMMRAMNETCRPNMSNGSVPKIEQTDDAGHSHNNQVEIFPDENEIKLLDSDVAESNSAESQKCLEDVTTKVDQDEYLKSILDRVVTQNGSQQVIPDLRRSEGSRPCIFCAQPFPDQDSLAMHVMSVHADQMPIANPNRNNVVPKPRDNIKWINPYIYPLYCKICGKKFVSRDNLAMHVLTHAQEEAATDSVRDSSMYPWKRKADQLSMTSEASLSSAKVARRFGNLGKHDNLVQDNHVLSASDLYCSSCSIQFYSKGDFEWHLRCRHNSEETRNEPVCLAKPESKDVTESLNADSSETEAVKASEKPKRRNSFSVDENSRHLYVMPQRPFSVDHAAKETTGACANNDDSNVPSKQMEAKDLKSKDLKIKKDIQKSMAIACVDALSSNEKRIIYSVFGSNLTKRKDAGDRKQRTEDIDKDNGRQKVVNSNPQTNMTTHCSPVSRDAQISKTSPNSASDLSENLHEALKGKDAAMCRYCEIIFLNKAIYYLHMGLHNVNNQWQCNVCGKICKNSVDFAAHIIHM